jgi:uroporphyrinogen-III decarboxylase
MNAQEWATLVAAVRGEAVRPLPIGFIIDSPWLPNWAGRTILDYYTRDAVYLEANLAAIRAFPRAMMLPGFWSEYGMSTEPSAFGARTVWGENEFPTPGKCLWSPADIEHLEKPDPRRHGLLPFVINRLKTLQPDIEAAGHQVRFAVARGPLNVAGFLMGMTEFLLAIKTAPDFSRRLLSLITDFLVDWVAWQRECFPSIDGILVLDDIVGFLGPDDYEAFALPYLARVFDTDVTVKFFHNDAPCKVCAPSLPDVGVNLLNFGPQHTLDQMRAWTRNTITLVGNIPPRDVLASGTPADVARATTELLDGIDDRTRLIVSCGGGMPPGASSANIEALISAVDAYAGGTRGTGAVPRSGWPGDQSPGPKESIGSPSGNVL